MKPIMGNFLAVLYSCFSFFSEWCARFINIRSQFYTKYWQFLTHFGTILIFIHLWFVPRPPKKFMFDI